MTVLFACGGTAGHINPALAIADIVKRNEPNTKILFAGTPNGMENRLVPAAGYEIRHIPINPFRRSLSPENLRAGASLFRSFRAARKLLDESTPSLVVGTGGYVCYPVLRVAASRGIPVVLHESNAQAGMAAKALARKTDLALVGFPGASKDFAASKKTVVSGNPLRGEFYNLTRKRARRELLLSDSHIYLVAFGGSLGAASINRALEGTVPRLLARFPTLVILHVVGEKQGKGLNEREQMGRYRRRAYVNDLPRHLIAADFALCRSGAMTVSEIAAAGVPSVLIPYPDASGDHQTKNAKAYADAGAAVLLPDRDLSPDRLFTLLSEYLNDPAKRKEMKEKLHPFAFQDTERIILRELKLLLSDNS